MPEARKTGENRECPHCGDLHEIKQDLGVPAALGFEKYFLSCPEYGYHPTASPD